MQALVKMYIAVFANSDNARIAFHNRLPGAVTHMSNIRWCALLDVVKVITENFGVIFEFFHPSRPAICHYWPCGSLPSEA